MRNVLFASAERLAPAAVGGAEVTGHELLRALARRGVEARALGAWDRADRTIVRARLADRLGPGGFDEDAAGTFRYRLEYEVEVVARASFVERLRGVFAGGPPELVVAQRSCWRETVREARSAGVPCVLYVQDAFTVREPVRDDLPDLVLYNSSFLAREVGPLVPAPSAVLYQPIDLAPYRAVCTSGDALTLVNPHPMKGLDRFLELADRLPERRFLAVEGWGVPPFVAKAIARRPNIELLPWQHLMAEVYARSSVLLVPSVCPEAFGRVVVEAAAAGVPCLTSGVGGLPEAAGGGGLHVPVEAGLDAWLAALARLEDPAERPAFAERALRHAESFEADRQADRFLSLVDGLGVSRGDRPAPLRLIGRPEFLLGHPTEVGDVVRRGDRRFTESSELEALLRLARSRRPAKALELYTAFGDTALALARALPACEVHTFDLCREMAEHRSGPFAKYVLPAELGGTAWRDQPESERIRFHLLPPARIGARARRDGPYELVYVDGDHTWRSVLADTDLALEAAADDAVLVWDDCVPDCPDVLLALERLEEAVGSGIARVAGTRLAFVRLDRRRRLELGSVVRALLREVA